MNYSSVDVGIIPEHIPFFLLGSYFCYCMEFLDLPFCIGTNGRCDGVFGSLPILILLLLLLFKFHFREY